MKKNGVLSKTLNKNIKFENNINIIKLEKEKLKNIISSHNKNIIFIAGNKKFDELANNIKIFGKIDVKTFKVIDTFKEMKINVINAFNKENCSNPNCKNLINLKCNESNDDEEEEEEEEDYDDEDYFKKGKYYECNFCCANYCNKCIKKCKNCKENICLFCLNIKYDKFEDIELCPDCAKK